MSEVITTAHSEMETRNFYEKNKLCSWKQFTFISYHGYLVMILTSVPCIMISHDLDKGTMVNHNLARLTMIKAVFYAIDKTIDDNNHLLQYHSS